PLVNETQGVAQQTALPHVIKDPKKGRGSVPTIRPSPSAASLARSLSGLKLPTIGKKHGTLPAAGRVTQPKLENWMSKDWSAYVEQMKGADKNSPYNKKIHSELETFIKCMEQLEQIKAMPTAKETDIDHAERRLDVAKTTLQRAITQY